MTREEALRNLNLPSDAGHEAVEKAYQRLARRYPPEFHPDKFRMLDESYRQLTSLPAMIEKLLAPAIEDSRLDPAILAFDPPVPREKFEDALNEIRTAVLTEALWKPSSPGPASKSKRK